MPAFKSFAEMIKNELGKYGFETGIIDASKNDIDIRISQYPTIIFFDKEGRQVLFNSPRNFIALQEFI